MYSSTNNYRLYLIILLLFLFDLATFNILEKQLLCSLLCLFCLQITRRAPWGPFLVMITLLALESFLYYSRFGLQLIYLIPLYSIGLRLQKTLYKSRIYPITVLLIALIMQSGLESYFLGLPTSLSYTISRIFVNIGILSLLSLIYK